METLGSKLKSIRNSKKLTLRQLGTAAYLSHSYIADIESGRCSNPSIDTVLRLARALGISPSALIDEEFENVAEFKPTYKGKKTEADDKKPKG